MGSLTSRQNAAVEEADVGSNHAYKYPPRSGNYFGSHFIMGGERFDTPQPEAYLFGENADLNFLGSRPTAFPYPPPQANEPTKTLKSLVNIRKESVRFVKAPDSATKIHGDGTTNKGNSFNIEFVFDSDAKCAVTIYYFCTEEVSATGVTYVPRDPSLTSETYHYKKGVNQYFSQNSHIFNPNLFSEDDLSYNPDKDVFPIAIHCIVDEDCRQSHTTICVVDHHTDGTYALRALKQKIFVDGLSYLLQEIYGIENKAINKPATEEDTDDNGSECVICMSDTRDTLILPCRHLCLCNSCADSLRYQANNCPICRAPFRALLQIRAVQKSSNTNVNHAQPQNLSDLSNEHIPPGYAPVSLIEALNGPPQCISRTSHDCGDGVENEGTQNTDPLTKNSEKNLKLNSKDSEKRAKEKSNSTPSEFRMSILLSKENGTAVKDSDKQSPLVSRSASISESKNVKEKSHSRQTSRDSVHVINERNNTKLEGTDPDDDSDAEKLSPLLNSNDKKSPTSALHIEGVEESIDDTDTDVEDGDCDVERVNVIKYWFEV
uniref:RING-type E3 ubiquitin transferase n=1 Tax=Tabanus bromius TaxID=304241 RepID=A0A0K8TL32_TABBR